MKSLSKGNNSRRDQLSSSSNLRESTALPLSSTLSTEPMFEDNTTYVTNERSRVGWSKQSEKEPSPPSIVDRVRSGRMAASVYSDYYKGQNGGPNGICQDDFDYTDRTYEKNKPSQLNNQKVETYQKSILEDKRKVGAEMKQSNHQDFEANNSSSDEDLIALLKVKHS